LVALLVVGSIPREAFYDLKAVACVGSKRAPRHFNNQGFDERRKIHDLLMEGVELALKKRGYPALGDMKAKWERKKP
jgi:hypothetical protein